MNCHLLSIQFERDCLSIYSSSYEHALRYKTFFFFESVNTHAQPYFISWILVHAIALGVLFTTALNVRMPLNVDQIFGAGAEKSV